MLAGVLLPMVPAVALLILGDARANLRAVEAMFSDLDHAVGHVTSFRIMAAGWAVFMLLTLAGFLVFALELWDEGERRLVVLAAAAIMIHATFVTLEVSYHMSVMAWAIQRLEEGAPVPEMVLQIRHWLNFWLQVFSNPLLLLAYIGFGAAVVRTELLWSWVGWVMIVWSSIWLFFPLPLLIYPVPVLLAITLLLHG